MTDFAKIRQDFPILSTGNNRGQPLIYLDSGASAQKPQQVIDAMSGFYEHDYANIHRGVYELSQRATKLYEGVREIAKDFINASTKEEIIFTRGTTEAINLVAQSLGRTNWHAGDEVILSEMEHHSNIVPWSLLRDQIGIALKIIPVLDDGTLDLDAYQKLFTSKTKLVSIIHASNVLGTINPIKEMTTIAHEHGALVLVDGAQAVPHIPVDVKVLDCDFYIFSAHKIYGPTGSGVLYGKKALLDEMPPYQGGGDMIETVAFDKVTYAPVPHKFEAGTPDFVSVYGMGCAINYIKSIGMNNIMLHEQSLLAYAEPLLLAIPGLKILGTSTPKVGVISFVMDGIHPHDIGTVLDHEGVAIRAGHHCAMPLMARFKVPATARASFGVYNNEDDVDKLVAALHIAKGLFT